MASCRCQCESAQEYWKIALWQKQCSVLHACLLQAAVKGCQRKALLEMAKHGTLHFYHFGKQSLHSRKFNFFLVLPRDLELSDKCLATTA